MTGPQQNPLSFGRGPSTEQMFGVLMNALAAISNNVGLIARNLGPTVGHFPAIAPKQDGSWGIFCAKCSEEEEAYTFPCKVKSEGWPASDTLVTPEAQTTMAARNAEAIKILRPLVFEGRQDPDAVGTALRVLQGDKR